MKQLNYILFLCLVVHCQSFISRVPLKMLNNLVLKYIDNSKVDTGCATDLKLALSEAAKYKLWALKMFDASTKIYPGILNGHFHLLGDYNECLTVEGTSNNRTIHGQYCTIKATPHHVPVYFLNSSVKYKELHEYLAKTEYRGVPRKVKHPVLLVGVCVPRSCSVENVDHFVNYLTQNLGFKAEVSVVEDLCSYKGKPVKTSFLDHWVLCFFIVVVSVIIASTVIDVYLRLTDRSSNIFVVFSAYTNTRRLLSQYPNNHNTLTCLNGIKVLTCAWVVLGHTVLFYRFMSKNVFYVYNQWNREALNSFMWSGYYSIDSFLSISGVLTSYIYLKHTEVFSVDLKSFYLVRYMRLTPALVATVLVHTSVLKFVASGPYGYYVANYVANNCCSTWWSSFFLFFKTMDFKRCAMHLGYLSIDNQLYLIAPLFLFFLKNHTSKVVKVMAFVFITCIGYSMFVTFDRKVGFTIFEWSDDYESYIYFSTLHHMPSWLLGMWFGYLFYYKRIKLSKRLNLCLWIGSLYVMVKLVTDQTVFLTEDYSLRRALLWNGLARPLWSLALCFIIYSCGIGKGGVINDFLSHSVFGVLSKLTYSMYLVHFSVLLYHFGNHRDSLLFENAQIWAKFPGIFVLVMMSSVLLYLGFEAPIVSVKDHLEGEEGEKNTIKKF